MSAARRVAHAAETVRARWEQQVSTDPQTEAAQALEDAGQLLDPEVAAELLAFRKERELAEAVAEYGAFPVPVGPAPRTLDVVEDELTGVSLSLYEEELLTERLRWALASAKRGRSRLRAQVAELNEALTSAAEALRANEAPVGPYPPVMRWAALLDREDLADFLDELAASAITNASSDVALAEVETTCRTWRLIAEAQHGHNTAPGPDAVTQTFAPVAALRELSSREEPHDSPLHHGYRVGHDLPETGGEHRG